MTMDADQMAAWGLAVFIFAGFLGWFVVMIFVAFKGVAVAVEHGRVAHDNKVARRQLQQGIMADAAIAAKRKATVGS